MAVSSPPSLPSSFDPAIHLHSEPPDNALPTNHLSESFSDDLEALHLHRLEQTRKGIVVQHRAWNLSDVFRSDDDITPDTPTKSRSALRKKERQPSAAIPSSPHTVKMPLISSPVVFPPSSSPPMEQKRKLGESFEPKEPKRQKVIGGFVDDDNDDDMDALRDAELQSEFALQEQILEQQPPEVSAALSFSLSEPSVSRPPISSQGSLSFDIPRPSARTQGTFHIKTCTGKVHSVQMKERSAPVSYERLVASRSSTAPGRAQKSYYGIEIHKLLDDAARETKEEAALRESRHTTVKPSIETSLEDRPRKKTVMWTEKYRARKFTDLIGDERTHRSVLRWLKGWDPIVFPGLARSKPKRTGKEEEEQIHRKVLLLTGPPGLGKTTLAHVCARQAGYEVLEINASDERSRDVVNRRIRDSVGTENVKSMNVDSGGNKGRKVGRPICVIVDEVDGVVSGSGGGGEGGFMKALIDLVMLDQKNSSRGTEQTTKSGRKRKGDNFRLLRPLILICNDVYHPSLRPLRASTIAEIIHVRQAPLENVVDRMKAVFNKEGIQCDNDGVRKLCEASWGLTSRRDRNSRNRGAGEGDIRSVLVAAEWIAHKLRAAGSGSSQKLTRSWLEQNVLDVSSQDGSKGLGRGGVREIVERVFMDGAGFPDAPVGTESFQDPFSGEKVKTPVGVADIRKRHAINRLREMVDTSGEYDRCVTECFAAYPTQTYQDDTLLSKPNSAYDWLYFHDAMSSKVFSNQDWELTPYLSQSVVAFHHLFASSNRHNRMAEKDDIDGEEEEEHPFSGLKADFAAFEAQKQNRAILQSFQSSFSASLIRMFRSMDSVATDLVPNLVRMLSPDIKPVVVGGSGNQGSVASVRKESERFLVQSAVRVMTGMGVTFEKTRVEKEGAHGGWIYRMEPPLDTLNTFAKVKGTSLASAGSAPVRYAVRQVLDQEYRKETLKKQSEASQLKYSKSGSSKSKQRGGDDGEADKENGGSTSPNGPVKRDFFGRIINEATATAGKKKDKEKDAAEIEKGKKIESQKSERKVWVTYHEGFSNAVRKPISMSELLAGL
ncbi:hypothetical protein VTN00DRAFT_2035 [Thermoascus crustaceus]|uniref:uncharacterized protein n=1 Tax=Thermoascus crustaceus TaxID=5088 RepID=UPI003744B118